MSQSSYCLRDESSCIADMAAGWILPPDFCPACTQRFIAVINRAFGPLKWHRDYFERTKQP